MRVPTGNLEMLSCASGARRRKVHGEGKKQAYIGNKLLVLTRSVNRPNPGERLTNTKQALLGFEKNITHLDGRTLQVVRKAVTQPGMPFFLQHAGFLKVSVGFVQVVKGEGMPSFGSKSSKGDLFIEYSVVLPVELTPDIRRSESLLNLIDSFPSIECLHLNAHRPSIILFPFSQFTLEYSNLLFLFF